MADFVVSLGQDGRILSQGTLSEALKSNKALLKGVKAEEAEVVKADETIDDVLPEIPEGKGGKLIAKEEIAEGHVSWSASKPPLIFCTQIIGLNHYVPVKMYIVGMGGSLPVLFWIVVLGCWSVEEVTLVVVGSYSHQTHTSTYRSPTANLVLRLLVLPIRDPSSMAGRLNPVGPAVSILLVTNAEVSGQIPSRIRRAPDVCDIC